MANGPRGRHESHEDRAPVAAVAERVYQRPRAAGSGEERRKELEKELLGHSRRGQLDAALPLAPLDERKARLRRV